MMNESDHRPPEGLTSDQTSYTCPGELYSISRGIHLSRLAAFYSKCRDCEHRFDSGSVVSWNQPAESRSAAQPPRTSLVSEDGVRAIYLNELDRNRAILWGEALAASLWDQQPMIATRLPRDRMQIIAPAKPDTVSTYVGPVVVVGFDERPSSPDIVTGAVQGLRRMGCLVVDLAQTSLPAVAFAVVSENAAAGLFVGGAGSDPAVTGFDLVARGGLPMSRDELSGLEQFVKEGVGRQTRQIGTHKPRQIMFDYLESLQNYFHALRPLRIVCGSSTRMTPRVLDRIFSRLPCTLTHVSLPTRRRDLFDGRDQDLRKIAETVIEGQNHLGVVFDEDGRRLAFVTDAGRLVSLREVARMIFEMALRQYPDAAFVVSTSWKNEVDQWMTGRNGIAIDGSESVPLLVQTLMSHDGIMALSADGRLWFRNGYPACDSMIVFAYVLQALSLSDALFSEVIARMNLDPPKS